MLRKSATVICTPALAPKSAPGAVTTRPTKGGNMTVWRKGGKQTCASKGGFESVAVCDAEFAPDDHARGRFLGAVDLEGRVVEGKDVGVAPQQPREDALAKSCGGGGRRVRGRSLG
eukprot:2217223-Rhodomonas_salina.3